MKNGTGRVDEYLSRPIRRLVPTSSSLLIVVSVVRWPWLRSRCCCCVVWLLVVDVFIGSDASVAWHWQYVPINTRVSCFTTASPSLCVNEEDRHESIAELSRDKASKCPEMAEIARPNTVTNYRIWKLL